MMGLDNYGSRVRQLLVLENDSIVFGTESVSGAKMSICLRREGSTLSIGMGLEGSFDA